MQSISFKAFDITEKKFFYPDSLDFRNGKLIAINYNGMKYSDETYIEENRMPDFVYIKDDNQDNNHTQHAMIIPYIGKNDSNNNNIYLGDIIEVRNVLSLNREDYVVVQNIYKPEYSLYNKNRKFGFDAQDYFYKVKGSIYGMTKEELDYIL